MIGFEVRGFDPARTCVAHDCFTGGGPPGSEAIVRLSRGCQSC
jgi:hypothetical protein